MKRYEVELTGQAREVYSVEAVSPEDAVARWMDGDLVVSESSGMGEARVVAAYDENGDEVTW